MTASPDSSNWQFILQRLQRFLPDSQAVSLAAILFFGSLLIYLLADLLMPVLASIVIAYLLNSLVLKAEKRKVPHLVAVYLVFFGFLTVLIFALFVLMPMVSTQAVQLIQGIPEMVQSAQTEIMRLPKIYPHLITEKSVKNLMLSVQSELLKYGQTLISDSAASVIGLVSALVYLFLVPMMVFFFLKDKTMLLHWTTQFMPKDRHLTMRVWQEVDVQIGNYVRGKLLEVLILGLVSYVTYSSMDLNYTVLLAALMGVSVVIPYIGATLVTFPVLGVAYIQWGISSDEFIYIVIAYSIIQALDGVVLVPLLFSEAVNLHPVAIIVAILFFGGLWGFWGVFFAIPLATLVKAVLNAWPKLDEQQVSNAY